MEHMLSTKIRRQLERPFPSSVISWKPQSTTRDGQRAMCVPYADLRAYEDRLDEVVPDWESTTSFTGFGERVACVVHLTIEGLTRGGDGDAPPRDNNAATTAYAQAFKRACSRFGLGKYLYAIPNRLLWVEYDKSGGKIPDESLKKLNAVYQEFVNKMPNVAPEAQHPDMIDKKGLSALSSLFENTEGYSMDIPQQWTNLLKSLSMPVVPPDALTFRRAGVVYWYIKEQEGVTDKQQIQAKKAAGKAIALLSEQREIDWQEAKDLYNKQIKDAARELGGAEKQDGEKKSDKAQA